MCHTYHILTVQESIHEVKYKPLADNCIFSDQIVFRWEVKKSNTTFVTKYLTFCNNQQISVKP